MISAQEPMVYTNTNGDIVMQVTTTIDNRNKTVSLCCDNSVGRLKKLSRSDIRLMIRHPTSDDNSGWVQDVTSEVFNLAEYDVVPATVDTMNRAMLWLNRVNWGFDR